MPSRANYPISIFSYRCLDRDRRSTWPDRDPHAGGADSKPRILSTQLAGAGGAQPRAPVIKINTLGTSTRTRFVTSHEGTFVRRYFRKYFRTFEGTVPSYKVQLARPYNVRTFEGTKVLSYFRTKVLSYNGSCTCTVPSYNVTVRVLPEVLSYCT